MNDEMQALCFLAGANSIFYGERLLTTDNPETGHDQRLFQRLGIHALDPRDECSDEASEDALLAQVQAQQTAPLYYDALSRREAKPVLPKRPAADA
jgi:biotin synthase